MIVGAEDAVRSDRGGVERGPVRLHHNLPVVVIVVIIIIIIIVIHEIIHQISHREISHHEVSHHEISHHVQRERDSNIPSPGASWSRCSSRGRRWGTAWSRVHS